jgi:hypothetical protein
MQMQRLVAVALFATRGLLTYASWGKIAGYPPGSKVTSHNAIDLDQAAIEIALGEATIDYDLVKNIYENGGNSKTYAEFTVPAVPTALSKSDPVVGLTSGVQGKMYSSYPVSTTATTIRVAYLTSDVQATYVKCKVGALQDAPTGVTAAASEPYKFQSECFQNEDLTITTSSGDVTVTPTGSPTVKAGRTLQGFSTGAGTKMYTTGPNGGCAGASDRATDGCPYTDFSMYYNYYGDFDYANKFVLAAIEGQPTNFANNQGDMDFSGTADELRKECIKKGTAYMNAYMYAIREFEDAIDDCKAGCVNGFLGTGANCNDISMDSVHAWDEGVAFYTGSREGAAVGGSTGGKLSYRLAEKRCANFKTCGENHNSTSGMSYVNTELSRQIAIGAHKVLLGDCEAVRPVVQKMVAIMAIPLIQGTLRYAYKVDVENAGDKAKGEGAVFAASIVPRVYSCSTADGQTIMDNMKVGASSTSFAAVKAAFENNYACMGITCEEVGGLWFDAESRYYSGAEPCSSSSASGSTVVHVSEEEEVFPVWGLIILVVASACFFFLLMGCVLVYAKEKKTGQPALAASRIDATTIGGTRM